ncbi:MAG TPA: SusC/RagA family TonB-linked outer membrane protein [Flavisolibacter sp.]|jgi:iron complex outermembrane receptor protein|nr:SusC/RagA family TonB-linked outer membrane protein [Flavisolibacter sp.]
MRKSNLLKAAICALILLIVPITHLLAQNRTVTGTVNDQTGKGVPGVTVTVKGTNTATQTNAEGQYTISAPENATLVFSAVGFTGMEMALAGRTSFDASLQASDAGLSEVVVIGYGTARRRDVTGSVATVAAKDFNRGVVTTPSQLIQGKVAGVLIVNNSGQPGGATTVRIRGNTSIRTGNQPLYVIDGVPIDGRIARPSLNVGGLGQTPASDPMYFINPFDISSIDVLKDASATAIYGSRGSNGVILITTRKGSSGAPRIDVNASAGISKILRKYDVLNAEEYRAALKSYSLTTGDFGGSVDAFDEITRTAVTQNYNIGISGGSETGKYRAAFGLFNQQGIIKNTDLKKYTANINGQYRFLESKKLSLDFNILTAHNKETIAPVTNDAGARGSLISQALVWNPTRPLRKGDGTLDRPGGDIINPLAMLEEYDDNARVSSVLANASVGYKLFNNLEYRFLYGINHQVGVRRAQVSPTTQIEGIQGRGIAFYGNNELNTQVYTHTLNYNSDLSQGLSLNALIGYEYQKFDFKGASITGQDFTSELVSYSNIFQNASQTSIRTSSFADPVSELQSYFGRAILNFRNRYLVTATLRADGSSKFGENNRYGYFPSFAAAWNISNEDFLTGNRIFSQLKLRAGYGITGNQEFPAGSAQAQYTFGQGSIALANVANPDLKWESTKQINVGIDFSLFRGKVFGAVDYFHKNTTDLLFNFSAIQPAPATRYWINLPGNLINSGLEVALNTALVKNTNITWNFGVNASFLHNELQNYDGPSVLTGALSGQGVSGATSQRLASGYALNTFYLRQFTGLSQGGTSTYQDGGNTLYYVGNPNPKQLLGITTDVSYKKLMLSVNANGAFGHQIYNNTLNSVLPISNLGTRNIDAILLGVPVQENTANPLTPSSRYLSKGNFLKLANATLSYSVGNIGSSVRNANIYITGQNLFVITKYRGFDPEVNTDKAIEGVPSFGIEYIPYPTSRTILIGVSFSL